VKLLRSRWAALVVGCLAAGVALGAVLSLVLRPKAETPFALASQTPVYGTLLARQHAPPFTLTDQNGERVSLAGQKGRLVLLAFMDPRCVNLCPILGRDIAALEQQLPASVHPDLLIVSVQPGRTAADVAHFVATNLSTKWVAGWHWLIGPDDAALKLTLLAWNVSITPPQDDLLAVIDPEGYLRVEYPAPVPIDDAVQSILRVDH
jgi:cytochrome oxidase Cu insertion factor (SCO1/SenC/PrrC family)